MLTRQRPNPYKIGTREYQIYRLRMPMYYPYDPPMDDVLNIHQDTLLTNRDEEVYYDDEEHKYYLRDRVYISATTIVSHFHERFDTKGKAEWMAYRYGKTPEYWIDEWRGINRKSLDRGNDKHDKQERFLYNQGFTSVTGSGRPIHVVKQSPSTRDSHNSSTQARIIPIHSLGDGCYPELKLWRHDWGIAGRCDKPTIETIQSTRYVHIEDWKTNKVIETSGYIDRLGQEKMMLYPLTHLPDCELTHYTLQLSLYQYMFEYFDYEPGIRRIIHFPHEIEGLGIPNPRPYELPYLRDEVESMLYTLKERRILHAAA